MRDSALKNKQLLWMLSPVLVFFLVFSYFPISGLIIAFKDYRIDKGILHSDWVGLANIIQLVKTVEFRNALANTIKISLLKLAFGFAVPILLAILLNEIRLNWYKRTVQTLIYLPYFFSWVLLGGIILTLFSTNGPANSLYFLFADCLNSAISFLNSIFHFGISTFIPQPIQFMTSHAWFLIILILSAAWQEAGYGVVIYLAALSGIPVQIFESSAVDGANRFQQCLHITLPSLMPTIVTLFLLRLGQVLNAGFDQVYNLYNPVVYESADIIDTFILRVLQGMDFSFATAAGLFKSITGMVLIITVNAIINKYTNGEKGLW